jgi:hypothetical protein
MRKAELVVAVAHFSNIVLVYGIPKFTAEYWRGPFYSEDFLPCVFSLFFWIDPHFGIWFVPSLIGVVNLIA